MDFRNLLFEQLELIQKPDYAAAAERLDKMRKAGANLFLSFRDVPNLKIPTKTNQFSMKFRDEHSLGTFKSTPYGLFAFSMHNDYIWKRFNNCIKDATDSGHGEVPFDNFPSVDFASRPYVLVFSAPWTTSENTETTDILMDHDKMLKAFEIFRKIWSSNKGRIDSMLKKQGPIYAFSAATRSELFTSIVKLFKGGEHMSTQQILQDFYKINNITSGTNVNESMLLYWAIVIFMAIRARGTSLMSLAMLNKEEMSFRGLDEFFIAIGLKSLTDENQIMHTAETYQTVFFDRSGLKIEAIFDNEYELNIPKAEEMPDWAKGLEVPKG